MGIESVTSEIAYKVLNRTDISNQDEDKTLVTEILVYLKIIIAIVGLCLNIFTIICISFLRQNLRPYLWHILNLTFSDFIMSLGIILYFILDEIYDHKTTVVHCFQFFIKSFEAFSILLCLCMLVVIAADQSVAVVWPLRYHQICTKKTTKLILICVWTFCVMVILSGVIISTMTEGGVTIEKCLNIKREYTLYVNAVLVIASFPVFLGLYVVIYSKIRALKRRDSQRGRRVSMKKATATTLLLVVPFLLVYLPMSIYILIITLFELQINWPFWDMFMVVLSAHTAADPVIYAIRVKEIQDGYKRFCCSR